MRISGDSDNKSFFQKISAINSPTCPKHLQVEAYSKHELLAALIQLWSELQYSFRPPCKNYTKF